MYTWPGRASRTYKGGGLGPKGQIGGVAMNCKQMIEIKSAKNNQLKANMWHRLTKFRILSLQEALKKDKSSSRRRLLPS